MIWVRGAPGEDDAVAADGVAGADEGAEVARMLDIVQRQPAATAFGHGGERLPALAHHGAQRLRFFPERQAVEDLRRHLQRRQAHLRQRLGQPRFFGV